jgi:hypothetical protein
MSTVAVQLENASSPRCDEAALIEIVERAIHPSAAEWLFLRELRVGTGRQNSGAQRLDAFALNTLPHMAMKRVCYEVKTSRADFLSELKRPLKRRDPVWAVYTPSVRSLATASIPQRIRRPMTFRRIAWYTTKKTTAPTVATIML